MMRVGRVTGCALALAVSLGFCVSALAVSDGDAETRETAASLQEYELTTDNLIRFTRALLAVANVHPAAPPSREGGDGTLGAIERVFSRAPYKGAIEQSGMSVREYSCWLATWLRAAQPTAMQEGCDQKLGTYSGRVADGNAEFVTANARHFELFDKGLRMLGGSNPGKPDQSRQAKTHFAVGFNHSVKWAISTPAGCGDISTAAAMHGIRHQVETPEQFAQALGQLLSVAATVREFTTSPEGVAKEIVLGNRVAYRLLPNSRCSHSGAHLSSMEASLHRFRPDALSAIYAQATKAYPRAPAIQRQYARGFLHGVLNAYRHQGCKERHSALGSGAWQAGHTAGLTSFAARPAAIPLSALGYVLIELDGQVVEGAESAVFLSRDGTRYSWAKTCRLQIAVGSAGRFRVWMSPLWEAGAGSGRWTRELILEERL
jgi:hypothetical protein